MVEKFLVFFLCCYFVFLFSCNDLPEKEYADYYRYIKIGSKNEVVGRYSVSKENAIKVNCYHFVYDAQSRPVKIENLRNGRVRGGAELSGFSFAFIIFKYSKTTETREFWVNSGFLARVQKIDLDDKGNRVSLLIYDSKDNLISDSYGIPYYKWTVDKRGRHIKSI